MLVLFFVLFLILLSQCMFEGFLLFVFALQCDLVSLILSSDLLFSGLLLSTDGDRSNIVPCLLIPSSVGSITIGELLGLPAPAKGLLSSILDIVNRVLVGNLGVVKGHHGVDPSLLLLFQHGHQTSQSQDSHTVNDAAKDKSPAGRLSQFADNAGVNEASNNRGTSPSGDTSESTRDRHGETFLFLHKKNEKKEKDSAKKIEN